MLTSVSDHYILKVNTCKPILLHNKKNKIPRILNNNSRPSVEGVGYGMNVDHYVVHNVLCLVPHTRVVQHSSRKHY